MKTITLTALAVTALAGAAALAIIPSALADGAGWGGRHGGGMGMMGGFGPMGGGFGGPQRMFEEFDTDGDGRLTQAEIDAVVGGKYSEANTDGQAGVTIEEFEPWFWAQHREMMVRAFQFLDSNGDGSISEEEVTDFTGRIVERMDRNNDGALTLEDRRGRGDGPRGGWHGDDRRGDRDGGGRRGWWRWGDDDDMPGRGMMGPGDGEGPGMGPGGGQGPGVGPGAGQTPAQ